MAIEIIYVNNVGNVRDRSRKKSTTARLAKQSEILETLVRIPLTPHATDIIIGNVTLRSTPEKSMKDEIDARKMVRK